MKKITFLFVLLGSAFFNVPHANAACPVNNPLCHPPPPPPPQPVPVPPVPSQKAAGKFELRTYRETLDYIGREKVITEYNSSGRPGSLTWNGASPLNCGHACVDAPEPPYPYNSAARTQGWLNFHWCCWGRWPFEVSKDFSILTEIGAVCDGWQTGHGRLKIRYSSVNYVFPGGGNWLANLIDFFDHGYTSDRLVREIGQRTFGFEGRNGEIERGSCRSLGVSVDNPSGNRDAFIWDPGLPIVSPGSR
jgi:hypothetical protein